MTKLWVAVVSLFAVLGFLVAPVALAEPGFKSKRTAAHHRTVHSKQKARKHRHVARKHRRVGDTVQPDTTGDAQRQIGPLEEAAFSHADRGYRDNRNAQPLR